MLHMQWTFMTCPSEILVPLVQPPPQLQAQETQEGQELRGFVVVVSSKLVKVCMMVVILRKEMNNNT